MTLVSDLYTVTVCTVVPQLDNGKQQNESIRKSLTLAVISKDNTPRTSTHVYTDGSATSTIRHEGVGIFIQYTTVRSETSYAAAGTH